MNFINNLFKRDILLICLLLISISPKTWCMGQKLEIDPNYEVIGDFLSVDITKEAKFVCELKEKSNEVQSGKLILWERIGKKYYALVMSDFLVLTKNSSKDKGQVLVPIEDFQKQFNQWFKKIEDEVSCPKIAN